jgi:hypothetical protein
MATDTITLSLQHFNSWMHPERIWWFKSLRNQAQFHNSVSPSFCNPAVNSSQSQSHIPTDGWSVSQSVMVSSPIWGSCPGIYYCLTFMVLFLWGAFSDERTGLSFIYAAGPCQRSLSRVRVPRDTRLYFTVSDLRLTFSSPPTTRTVTVEVFDPVQLIRLCKLCCCKVSVNRVEVTSFNSTVMAFLAVTLLWTLRCRGYRLSVS